MSIRTRRLVISSSFLPLSWDSFDIFPFPILSFPISHICVPLTPLWWSEVLHSFARGSPRRRRQLLQFLRIHPPPLIVQQVEWHLRPSWNSLCAWIFALTLSVMSCIRWTPMSVVLHDDKLWWVVSQWLPLPLRQLLRMRITMAPAMLMMLRMMMMARLVTIRCLLDLRALCHSWQKGGVVLRWE